MSFFKTKELNLQSPWLQTIDKWRSSQRVCAKTKPADHKVLSCRPKDHRNKLIPRGSVYHSSLGSRRASWTDGVRVSSNFGGTLQCRNHTEENGCIGNPSYAQNHRSSYIKQNRNVRKSRGSSLNHSFQGEIEQNGVVMVDPKLDIKERSRYCLV